MTPNNSGRPRLALLASGARFSCALLQALLRRNCRPALLMLPEYAPAGESDAVGIDIAAAPEPPLLRLAADIETGYAPPSRQREAAAMIEARGIDVLLVACWPYLIGDALIDSVAGAALNLHPSLLPKYRGPDPLQQQLAAGDERFGVTLHLLDGQFDHGDIVAQAELSEVDKSRDAKALEWRCAELGALLFVDALRAWPNWNAVPQARSVL